MSLGITKSRKLEDTFSLVDALVTNVRAMSEALDRVESQLRILESRVNAIESRRLTLNGKNR